MKIPQGYKQTELGIIPEDWEVKTIGDYYEVTSSKRVFQSQWRRIGVPFFRAREIVILADKGKVDNELFIDQELYDLYKRQYGVPQAGDVLVTGVGTLGRLYVVQSNDSPFYFKDGNIIWFKNKGYNSVLLSYLFQTDSVISQITDNSGGSTVGTYTIQNAINTKIITPNLPAEQNAIAEALSDVDALIAALDKKIAKKRLIKQGAMQQLLTGKKRLPNFSEKWVSKKLGEISRIKTGKRNGDEQVKNGKYPFFVRSNVVARIDSYSFDGEAILVPGEGGIGAIFHYVNGKFDYHQRVYKISDFADAIYGKYVYYYMQRYFGEYALSLSVKATVDSLRLPTFEEFSIGTVAK